MTLATKDRLGAYLREAEQEIVAAKAAALRPHGLNVAQYLILLVLNEEPGLTGAALARRCLVTPQTMSSVLSTLESKGLVSRTSHALHTHIQEARPTKEGLAVLAKADKRIDAMEQRFHDAFDDEERARFLEYLQRVRDAIPE